jgi:hypothetical protein
MKREIFVFDLLDNEGLHGLVLLGVGEGEELLLVQPPVSATIRGQEQVSGTGFLYSLLITILPRTEIEMFYSINQLPYTTRSVHTKHTQ